MQRYFANLDSSPTYTTLAEVLDGELLDKWAVLDSLQRQLRITPDGYEKTQQYVTPETRWVWADYSVDIEPGDFGVLVSGREEEFAFRRVKDSMANKSALLEYQSGHWMYDRDYVLFDIVCEQPETYDIDFTQFCY